MIIHVGDTSNAEALLFHTLREYRVYEIGEKERRKTEWFQGPPDFLSHKVFPMMEYVQRMYPTTSAVFEYFSRHNSEQKYIDILTSISRAKKEHADHIQKQNHHETSDEENDDDEEGERSESSASSTFSDSALSSGYYH